MSKNPSEKLMLLPRSFAIIFALFISMFSFEAFGSEAGTETGVKEFFLLLIPALVTLAVIAITWKKPKLTGVYFLLFAIGFAVYFIAMKNADLGVYGLAFGTPAIIGVLFLSVGRQKPAEEKPQVKAAPKAEAVSEESEEAKAE